jgi:predicted Fe-S protein YdhL (DUF1289 family)
MTGLFDDLSTSMVHKAAQSIQNTTDLMIASPCTALCIMDEKREYCTGCYRTLDEIMHWSQFNREQKHAINKAAAERRAATRSIDPQ